MDRDCRHVLEVPLPLPPFTDAHRHPAPSGLSAGDVVFLILRFTRARRREAWLAGEFEAARQIQQVLLPDQQDQCPGFNVECIYQPADQVGGDFFQQIGDSNCGMLIVVGDVSGKGLPAAMLVSVLVGAIRAEAAHDTDPAAMLRSLNDRLMGRAHGGFTTCLAAHITAGGLLTLANAGHLPPYLNGEEFGVPGTLPLGLVAHAHYECTTACLAPGDRLTFVSDGVVEAQSKSGELFGFDRTRELSRMPAASIARSAQAFGQQDDITVVTVEFSGTTAPVAIVVRSTGVGRRFQGRDIQTRGSVSMNEDWRLLLCLPGIKTQPRIPLFQQTRAFKPAIPLFQLLLAAMLRNHHRARGQQPTRSPAQQLQRACVLLVSVIRRVEKHHVEDRSPSLRPAQKRPHAPRMNPKSRLDPQSGQIRAHPLQGRRSPLHKRHCEPPGSSPQCPPHPNRHTNPGKPRPQCVAPAR